MKTLTATVGGLMLLASVCCGCAIRFRGANGQEHLIGCGEVERRGAYFVRRSTVGLTFDFVEPALAVGWYSLADRLPEPTTRPPSEVWLNGPFDQPPAERQWFFGRCPLPVDPRYRHQTVGGLLIGKSVGGGHVGCGWYEEWVFDEITPAVDALFIAMDRWNQPASVRGWIWRNEHDSGR